MQKQEKPAILLTAQSTSATNEFTTDDEMQALVESMRDIFINDKKDLEVLKTNLKITRQYRDDMLSNMKLDLHETFPYFFINTDLVSIYT